MLKSDMRSKIERDLGIDIQVMGRQRSGSDTVIDGVAVNSAANNNGG